MRNDAELRYGVHVLATPTPPTRNKDRLWNAENVQIIESETPIEAEAPTAMSVAFAEAQTTK